MTWIITQDMMDRACAIFTATTGNPLRDAKRVEVQKWCNRHGAFDGYPNCQCCAMESQLTFTTERSKVTLKPVERMP